MMTDPSRKRCPKELRLTRWSSRWARSGVASFRQEPVFVLKRVESCKFGVVCIHQREHGGREKVGPVSFVNQAPCPYNDTTLQWGNELKR
jgi:hypothetical protein